MTTDFEVDRDPGRCPAGPPAAPSVPSPVPGPAPGRAQRYALIVAAATAAFMVPWCGYLALTLPARATAEHWALAWAGLDAAEGACAAATAVLLRRRRPQAYLSATLGAGLLITDAWFDICTAAAGFDRYQAVGALAAELPLAALALAFAWTGLSRVTAGRTPDGSRPERSAPST